MPKNTPKRRTSIGRNGRIALLHKIAHIDLNAIELAFDVAGRLAIFFSLVLEAHGLDVTPQLINKVESVGDEASQKFCISLWMMKFTI